MRSVALWLNHKLSSSSVSNAALSLCNTLLVWLPTSVTVNQFAVFTVPGGLTSKPCQQPWILFAEHKHYYQILCLQLSLGKSREAKMVAAENGPEFNDFQSWFIPLVTNFTSSKEVYALKMGELLTSERRLHSVSTLSSCFARELLTTEATLAVNHLEKFCYGVTLLYLRKYD